MGQAKANIKQACTILSIQTCMELRRVAWDTQRWDRETMRQATMEWNNHKSSWPVQELKYLMIMKWLIFVTVICFVSKCLLISLNAQVCFIKSCTQYPYRDTPEIFALWVQIRCRWGIISLSLLLAAALSNTPLTECWLAYTNLGLAPCNQCASRHSSLFLLAELFMNALISILL